MKHEINGAIIETTDCNQIAFMDTSEYLKTIEPKNFVLQITPPNWETYFPMTYKRNSIMIINPEHIAHGNLPSGVYHIRQSVKPNDKLYHEFCYLKTCCERLTIAEVACDASDEDMLTLLDIKLNLDIAQDMVSIGKVKEGTEIYNIQVKRLNKFKNCDIC